MSWSLRARTLSALLLASTSSVALAQGKSPPADAAQSEDIIDEVVTDEAPPQQAPAPTGDAVLDRLNALEARIRTLEARNKQLEDQLNVQQGRVESVEVRAAKGVQPNVSPTHADPNNQFSFKVRGVVDIDYAAFIEREGGYDYNNGTAFRRARLGAEGTAFTNFNWRLEVDFAGNAVSITDAYLQYAGVKPWLFTLGQHKAPFSLESNNSDNYNVFIERGMLTNAFGNVGAERRIGASAAYQRDQFTASIGVFGDNESISRSTGSPVTDTPDESWGVNGRVTWDPVFDTGNVVHVGASGFWRTALKSGDTGDAVRITERPNIRVDNGNIVDSGVIPGVDKALYLGAEAAVVHGPFTAWGEYGRLKLERFDALSNPDFDSFYAAASYFLTGETRPFRNGNFDRVRPTKNFEPGGGWGALELALRYDHLDASETPIVARAGNEVETFTTALNWYFNPNFKFQLNWIRFTGDNTPLDPVGASTKGDAVAARIHLDW
jgi:phosphate-selective porin OprO/OprP